MPDLIFATVKALDDDAANPNGGFSAVLSTKSLDRDNEVVDPDAFEPLPASIPVYMEHDWKSGAKPVGRGVPTRVGDEIHLKATFASTAAGQEARTLVNEGIVDSMSVGFLNGKREIKSGVKTVTKGDLFEGSLTAIPINTGARVLTSKSGARNSASDMKHIQAAHDHMASLGADCSGSKSIADTKAIEGSVEALQARVRDALEDAYGEWATNLRGVLPDRIIFDWYAGDGDTYSQTYEDDGAVVTLTGTATEVDVHEIVVPDADADRETGEPGPTMLSVATSTAGGAATAASPAVTEATAKAIAAARQRQAQAITG